MVGPGGEKHTVQFSEVPRDDSRRMGREEEHEPELKAREHPGVKN